MFLFLILFFTICLARTWTNWLWWWQSWQLCRRTRPWSRSCHRATSTTMERSRQPIILVFTIHNQKSIWIFNQNTQKKFNNYTPEFLQLLLFSSFVGDPTLRCRLVGLVNKCRLVAGHDLTAARKQQRHSRCLRHSLVRLF